MQFLSFYFIFFTKLIYIFIFFKQKNLKGKLKLWFQKHSIPFNKICLVPCHFFISNYMFLVNKFFFIIKNIIINYYIKRIFTVKIHLISIWQLRLVNLLLIYILINYRFDDKENREMVADE